MKSMWIPFVLVFLGRYWTPEESSASERWMFRPGEDAQKSGLKRQVTDTFATLNDVDGKRKKNMVWIQKIPGAKRNGKEALTVIIARVVP